jgi:hypothetical protein
VVEFISAFQGHMGVKASCLEHSLVAPITTHVAGEESPSALVSVHDQLIFFSPDLLQIIPAFLINLESSWCQHQRVPTGTFGT